ncbi:MAG: diguanylate cyclase [Nitrospirae bacterium]|nr:MAG: diguanylate cyclase [Nitrospirota bacterium]
MSLKKVDINDKLKQLAEAYAGQLPAKAEEIGAFFENIMTGKGGHDIKGLCRLVHTLKGSSASFGYLEVRQAALSLEECLKNWDSKGALPDNDSANGIRRLISLLGEACSAPAISASTAVNGPQPLSSGVALSKEKAGTDDSRLVYVVEHDQDQLDNLARQLKQFRYDVRAFTSLQSMRDEALKLSPAVIIVDIVSPEGTFSGTDTIVEINKDRALPVPVVFISGRVDIEARIEAVRAGANAYFVKPVNIIELVEKLDALTTHEEIDEYRVLIVDDDPEIAAYHSLILSDAGMSTCIVTNPLQVFQPLIEFSPDLILMDVYMPQCNGMELAKAIRQIGTYFSIPIVYLSAETNMDKQISAMSMGGDEFLTKPIKPEHLLASVSIRAERMRIIRSFMERDSLTGLFNHTKAKKELDISVSRARRSGGELCFSMVDIDKFKSINDTYGHPVGDRVIVALSRLLQQRLRKTDIIGRYGGEEFAVVLPDTDAASSFSVLNDIRKIFSGIRFDVETGSFTATFSCGIASIKDYKDPAEIGLAADRALYEAKNSGRNRVIIAGKGE